MEAGGVPTGRPRRGRRRRRLRPRGLGCYPSDTYDDEWALIEPLLPVPACETPTGGRPEKHPRREIVVAIRYVVDTGCKWRALPSDFPPWRTRYGFMARWAAAGIVGQIHYQLRKRIRREMGRAPGAVATVIDSQSVKAAETLGRDSRGYDGAKKINGRKRHLVVDTKGLPLFVMVTPADMTDRDAAKEALRQRPRTRSRRRHRRPQASDVRSGRIRPLAETSLASVLTSLSRALLESLRSLSRGVVVARPCQQDRAEVVALLFLGLIVGCEWTPEAQQQVRGNQ
ncbi:putative transposase (plasmid) [Streptomyces collinus Tu 365]|uniref:Putative transposase n=1 Tax=Streptomyces collinus (strain DSM 40733 / Tue 365) TaxID=1214242 RepID=S5VST3_STRC3|nr:putative transposase [Streptomyces collinus Tu 365]